MEKCECCDGHEKDLNISFCPTCKSRDVKYVFGLGNLFGVIPKMQCKDCGFECQSFPVLTISPKDLQKAVQRVKKKVAKRKIAKKKVIKKKVIKKKKVVKKK